MPSSQMHGKSFENHLKAANNGIFSYAAADRKRSPNDLFDISAEEDLDRGIPTSIKSTGSDSIPLSDARRFWGTFDLAPYRMLVGRYLQEKDIKKFNIIHGFVIRSKYRHELLGDVDLAEIVDFHEGLRKFEKGRHAEAREWHTRRNNELKERLGLVRLNPKVDSKTQRRLQCSVSLSALIDIVDRDDYTVHTKSFGTIVLPLKIISSPRKRRTATDSSVSKSG